VLQGRLLFADHIHQNALPWHEQDVKPETHKGPLVRLGTLLRNLWRKLLSGQGNAKLNPTPSDASDAMLERSVAPVINRATTAVPKQTVSTHSEIAK
jgi:hypothetical protein